MMRRSALFFFCFSSAAFAQQTGAVGDWPDWRGPDRDGISREKGLPEKWSLDGQDLAWKAPYGGRSTPVVLGDHLYLENTAGASETEQERLMCFNADTGKLLWEYKFNLYQSDVPAHRVGWASPVADPETGNVYSFGVNNLVTALTKDGKKLWERSITEEFSPFTTHGGRTVSPMIDGNLVIVSTPTSTWGTQANRAQRFIALDKRTGDIVWISTPGGRPYDTSYGPMNIATVNGTRLLLAGGSDGAALAMKPQTGEPVWNLVIAKRGLNTGIVVNGNYAIVSHGDENLDSNEMGMIAAFDATRKGKLGKDAHQVVGARIRGRLLFAGHRWRPHLSGRQRRQPFCLRRRDRPPALEAEPGHRAESVDGVCRWQDLHRHRERQVLHPASARRPLRGAERGGTAAQRARALCRRRSPSRWWPRRRWRAGGSTSFRATRCTPSVRRKRRAHPWKPVVQTMEPGQGDPAWVQVEPTELVLKPGQTVQLHARLFDAAGRFLREEKSATWSLDRLKGTVADGKFAVAADPVGQAGLIKATVGSLTGEARARVIPPLPWNETFDAYAVGSVPPQWVSAQAGQFQVAELDGQKVLEKQPTDTLFKRMRVFMGPSDWSNYTVEADVRITEKRRQMGDAGIIAQRYTLVAFGNNQRLEMNSWQPEVARAAVRAVRLEAGHLVSPEAARGKHRRRQNAHPRQSLGGRAIPSRTPGSSIASIRFRTNRAVPASSPTPSLECTSITLK